jgi:antitoxin component of RelBE/YafQ-DinJ toxin-antitoxin module
MPAKQLQPQQIAFRYRAADSATGVTRATAKRLAEHLGVDETQAIHLALHQLATKVLPQYEADDGPLTVSQLRQIRKLAAPTNAKHKRSLSSSLFDTVAT